MPIIEAHLPLPHQPGSTMKINGIKCTLKEARYKKGSEYPFIYEFIETYKE